MYIEICGGSLCPRPGLLLTVFNQYYCIYCGSCEKERPILPHDWFDYMMKRYDE